MLMMHHSQRSGGSLLIGVEAVADLVGVSKRTIYRYLDTGRMPKPVQLPGRQMWRRADIEEWVACDCSMTRFSIRKEKS